MSRVEIYREDRVVKWVRAKGMEPADLNVNYSARESVHPGKGKWRWRFVKNGHIMADSGQGYSRRIDCLNGCATVLGAWVVSGDLLCRADAEDDDFHWQDVPVVDLTRKAKP